MLVAQALLEKAIAIDPNYAQALAVLAVSHTFGAHMGWEDGHRRTDRRARGARGDPRRQRGSLGASRAWAGLFVSAGDFDDALAELELALRLNPNFSLAQGYYGLVLSYCGRWEEGD